MFAGGNGSPGNVQQQKISALMLNSFGVQPDTSAVNALGEALKGLAPPEHFMGDPLKADNAAGKGGAAPAGGLEIGMGGATDEQRDALDRLREEAGDDAVKGLRPSDMTPEVIRAVNDGKFDDALEAAHDEADDRKERVEERAAADEDQNSKGVVDTNAAPVDHAAVDKDPPPDKGGDGKDGPPVLADG
jgi:hypothetical protein